MNVWLNSGDLRWFSSLVRKIHACTEEKDLFAAYLPEIHDHFRSHISVAEEVAYDLSSYRLLGDVGKVSLPPDFLPALADSPGVWCWQSRQRNETLHLRAMVSLIDLHRTLFHEIVGKTLGIEDQLIGTFATGPGVSLNCSVNRIRPFSAEEKILMEEGRRHVYACLLRLRRSTDAPRGSGRREIFLGANERPLALSPICREVMTRYFPDDRALLQCNRLPEQVQAWVRASTARLRDDPPTQPLFYLRQAGPNGHLILRLFPFPDRIGAMIRLTEEMTSSFADASIVPAALTSREREILRWLCAGKRDSEIGVIVECSARTVSKHLERIFRKIGARNRQAAAHFARGWDLGQKG